MSNIADLRITDQKQTLDTLDEVYNDMLTHFREGHLSRIFLNGSTGKNDYLGIAEMVISNREYGLQPSQTLMDKVRNPTSDDITALNMAAIISFLTQMYHYIQYNSKIVLQAAKKMQQLNRPEYKQIVAGLEERISLIEASEREAEEEAPHYKWVVEGLEKAFGLSIDEIKKTQPSPQVIKYGKILTEAANSDNPLSYLGGAYMLNKWTADRDVGSVTSCCGNLIKYSGIPKIISALKVYLEHAVLDLEHYLRMRELIANGVPLKYLDHEAIVKVGKEMAVAYPDIYSYAPLPLFAFHLKSLITV